MDFVQQLIFGMTCLPYHKGKIKIIIIRLTFADPKIISLKADL